MDKKICEIVAATLNVALSSVVPSSSPESLTSWDSTGHIRVVLAIEDAYGIEFSEQQIVEMTSVQKLIDGTRALAKV